MPIINQRWPSDLTPETCEFGRSRNDIVQISPRSRRENIIRQGRALWAARVTWTMPNTERLAKLRYWLEQIDGFSGSVQLWDFASPYPFGLTLATVAGSEKVRLRWVNGGTSTLWTFAGLPSHWVLGSTVTASAVAAIGATSISLTGLQANTIAAVQGQYIQIGRRIYLVAQSALTNGAGAVTLTLSTPLLKAVAIGDTVRLVEAGCEMRLADQDWRASAGAGAGLISVTASFIETVEDFV